MPKSLIIACLLIAPFPALAETTETCERAMIPRPLGLSVPGAKAELERLRYLPPKSLTSTREFHEALAKLIPPGSFEVMLTTEQRIGGEASSLPDHPPLDRMRVSYGGPTLDARNVALRATLSNGRRNVLKVDVPTHEKTFFDVGFSQNRYHASFTSLKSTLVLQYDEGGKLVKIFAFRRENPHAEREPVRGTIYHFLIPTT